jgi:hypothetical protein
MPNSCRPIKTSKRDSKGHIKTIMLWKGGESDGGHDESFWKEDLVE